MALAVPRFPRLKEWAYAGAVFSYTGAVASHLAVGDGARSLVYPVIQLGLVAASWALRPAARRHFGPASPTGQPGADALVGTERGAAARA